MVDASPSDAFEPTPEMVAAGMKVLALFDSRDPAEWVVEAVFRAMQEAARSQLSRGSSAPNDPITSPK